MILLVEWHGGEGPDGDLVCGRCVVRTSAGTGVRGTEARCVVHETGVRGTEARCVVHETGVW